MKKALLIFGLFVLVIVALLANKFISKESETTVKNIESIISVKTEKAITGKIEGVLNYTGNVQGIHEATVMSQTAGVVTKVNISVGKRCSAGEILAVIENAQQQAGVEQARSQLLAAEQALEKTKMDLKRYEKLYGDKVVTKDNLEMSQLAVKSSEAQMKGAQAMLKVAEKQLADTYIKATIPGYVSTKDIDIGSTVIPGTKIAHLVDISKFKIRIMVAENDAAKLHEGKPAKVKIDAMPGQSFDGKIDNIGLNTENGLRSYPVEIVIENKTKSELKSGMFARCEINSESKDNAILVPEKSVIMNNDGTTQVYIMQSGKAVVKEVKLGVKNSGKYEILSGISADEIIITEGKELLTNGIAVKEN